MDSAQSKIYSSDQWGCVTLQHTVIATCLSITDTGVQSTHNEHTPRGFPHLPDMTCGYFNTVTHGLYMLRADHKINTKRY